MCRNIRTLHNLDPAASEEEIRSAALQFVRKISGFVKPPEVNQKAFDQAVAEVARAVSTLLGSLVSTASPRNREDEAAKARARAVRRFGP